MLTYATTFSGIGGWELGLNACGWKLQWQCEREPFCRALLRERFGVPIYDDIRTICEHNPAPVDALIGSPPCQPFSVAGKKSGTSDERHLYPAFLDLVRHLKPRWVLMEQVPNILSLDGGRAFGGYIGGLAALRYSVIWHCIPACAVGANHQRDRLWIVAHAGRAGIYQRRVRANAGGEMFIEGGVEWDDIQEGQWTKGKALANPESRGWTKGRKRTEQQESKPDASRETKALADSQSKRRNNGDDRYLQRQATREINTPPGAGCYCGELEAGWWATEPAVGRVANGVPNRAHRLKGLGNAVVPQIPYLIGQAINQIEDHLTP